MRKKLILFLMLALFGSTGFLRADELTVHDGTATNSYVPVYGFYGDAYLKCEMVFPAAELEAMNGGAISGFTFYASSPASDAWTSTFQVFLKEVSDETISAFYGTDGAAVVYEGTLDGTGSSMTITFNEPFQYNGGNLLVGFYNITKGNYKSVSWLGDAVDGSSVQGYNYNDLGSISPTQRNFLPKTTFVYSAGTPGPTPPPTPTGEFVVTPNPFTLGDRPTNGWMAPYTVRLYNGGAPVAVSASMSNTSEAQPFTMEPIDNMALATGEEFNFDIQWNTAAPAGDYQEEFTLFYVESNRDMIAIPVTATIYTAGPADIVETAVQLSYTGTTTNFSETPADLHPNYLLTGMTTMATDAVYKLHLTKDAKFSVNAGNNLVAVYNAVTGFHPTAAEEPVLSATNGVITDQILLSGDYYMIVAGGNIATITGTFEAIPAPTELVALLPLDGATGVEAPVTLTWEGGENATEYQVLFGTSPVNMDAVLDWTLIDDNYGSFDVSGLIVSNTQYFWQIKARNSEGTVQTTRRGFTTTLTAPNSVTASAEEIFTDGSTLIKWKHSTGGVSELPETQIGSGTGTNSYLPTYNLYNYSLTEQIYTGDEIGDAGIITSISFYPVGTITRNLDIYLVNTDKTSFSGDSDWVPVTADDLVYSGNVAMTPNNWVTVELNEPFEFDGSNLLLVVDDNTGTWTSSISYNVFDATGQAIRVYNDNTNYNPATPESYSGTVMNVKNQIILNKESSKGVAQTRTFQGYNLYYGDVKVNTELIQEKQYLLSGLPYNIEPGHDINVTAVYYEGESGHSTPIVTVKVSGYGTMNGTVTELISGNPVAGVNVKIFGKDEFNNDVNYEAVTDANGQYTITHVKAGTYDRGIASLEGMEPANMANPDPVVLAYQGTGTMNFVIHETYNPVFKVFAQELDPTTAKVTWSLYDFANPVTPGGPTGGTGSTFAVNFDDSTIPAGWTMIDGDGDGSNWTLGSIAMQTGYGHNGSNDMILSKSYDNNMGALNPNNFLVTPQVDIVNGSTFSFYACAQDASWASEHFGVGVSTAGNTSASDFTMVQEWTMTAKGSGVLAPGRDGVTRAQGTWYQYDVDLSAYAGQQVYIAIRHFNCTDWFYLDVDDIELTAGSKGNRAVQEYALYRKAILKETALVEEDSVFFGTVTHPDSLYADFDWNNVEPGLYQYGVSAHYPVPAGTKGNRDEVIIGAGATTNSYVPTYNLYNYSCTHQIYTAEEIGGAGTITSIAFMPVTVNDNSRNLNIYMVNTDKTSFASGTDWIPVTDADLVYSGNVTWTANAWSTITLNTPFQFDGTNLAVIVNDLTGTWTSSNSYKADAVASAQALRIYQDAAPYNPSSPGSGTTQTTKNQIKLEITYGAGGGGNDNPETPITWSNILPKDINTNVTVIANVPVGSAEGTTVRFHNTFEQVADITATLDETGMVEFPEFRKGEYTLTVALDDYTCEYDNYPISIWGETTITVDFQEIFKPVDEIKVSSTGFARWTPVVPQERVPERYVVKLNGALYAEDITDNFLQLEGLTEGQEYTAGVAVMYSTGLSEYKYATFTYVECVDYAFESIYADNEDMDVTLHWSTGTGPTPPPTPGGDVVVKLTAGDIWGDGTGYQMLLDDTHSLYGSVIPTSGALSTNCSGNEGIYNQFSYKIPTNADGNCTTSNIVYMNTVEITIPAGTYDWCITNPTPGDRIWIAASNGNVGGRYDDYVFEGGHTYEFTISMFGSNDGVNVTITGGKSLNQPNMGIMSLDNRTNNEFVNEGVFNAGMGHGTANNSLADDGQWYYYDNGVNEDAIGTGGGEFWWGIMLPAGSYEGNMLSKVAAYDYMAMSGDAKIYQGGTSAPAGAALGQVSVNFTGSNDFVEFTFAEPVELDPDQNVWVIFHNASGATYPAAVCNNTGDPNGRWVSLDGASWEDLASYSLNYTFMVRAYIEAGGAPVGASVVTPNKFNIFVDGELVGVAGANATTFTWTCPDYAMHHYEVVWIDSNYNFYCPAAVDYRIDPDDVNEISAKSNVYPNPTSGDIRIVAENMVRISIVNAFGQVVYDKEVECNETTINMAQFGNGVYVVNIATENGTAVKRVVVSK